MTKRILLLLLTFISVQNVWGQKMPSDYFEEGEKHVEAQDYKNAIASFQYIVSHHPRNDLYSKAYYNVGYCYFMNKQVDRATLIFESILNSDFNEKESSGGGLMADPYTNYRHRASEILSIMFYDKTMYDSSLYYFALSDTAYPYIHFCGNEYAANDVHTALRYADIYEKLGNKGKAIQSLLPAVFITLSDNSKVISKLRTLLGQEKNLKREFDLALDSIYSKNIRQKDYEYTQHYFKFRNVEILVPEGWDNEDAVFNNAKAIEDIKKTKFYKMIETL